MNVTDENNLHGKDLTEQDSILAGHRHIVTSAFLSHTSLRAIQWREK